MTETVTAPVTVTLRGDRTRTVPLTYPAELADGTLVREVTVRRMTAAEAAQFQAAAVAGKDFPASMLDISEEVFDQLDPDDQDEINGVIVDFLPRRWRAAIEQTRAIGEATLPPSPASSEAASSNTSA